MWYFVKTICCLQHNISPLVISTLTHYENSNSWQCEQYSNYREDLPYIFKSLQKILSPSLDLSHEGILVGLKASKIICKVVCSYEFVKWSNSFYHTLKGTCDITPLWKKKKNLKKHWRGKMHRWYFLRVIYISEEYSQFMYSLIAHKI